MGPATFRHCDTRRRSNLCGRRNLGLLSVRSSAYKCRCYRHIECSSTIVWHAEFSYFADVLLLVDRNSRSVIPDVWALDDFSRECSRIGDASFATLQLFWSIRQCTDRILCEGFLSALPSRRSTVGRRRCFRFLGLIMFALSIGIWWSSVVSHHSQESLPTCCCLYLVQFYGRLYLWRLILNGNPNRQRQIFLDFNLGPSRLERDFGIFSISLSIDVGVVSVLTAWRVIYASFCQNRGPYIGYLPS